MAKSRIGPLVAPNGTTAVIEFGESIVNLAGDPLKLTAVTPPNLLPSIQTEVPTGPLAGVNRVITGRKDVTFKATATGAILTLGAVPVNVTL